MADIKQMPLRMPVHVWEAAKKKAGPNSLNAWIVDLIQREVRATPPPPSLMDAMLVTEAVASTALDGETWPVDTDGATAGGESARNAGHGSAEDAAPGPPPSPVEDAGVVHQGVPGHLHRGVNVGDPYRSGPGGMMLVARRCSVCGEDLPPRRA